MLWLHLLWSSRRRRQWLRLLQLKSRPLRPQLWSPRLPHPPAVVVTPPATQPKTPAAPPVAAASPQGTPAAAIDQARAGPADCAAEKNDYAADRASSGVHSSAAARGRAQRSTRPTDAGSPRHTAHAGSGWSRTASARRGSRPANFPAAQARRPKWPWRSSRIASTISRQARRTASRSASNKLTASRRLSATSGDGRRRPRWPTAASGKTGTSGRANTPSRPALYPEGKRRHDEGLSFHRRVWRCRTSRFPLLDPSPLVKASA